MPYADPAKNQTSKREWVKAIRAAWFADKTCARCGSTDRLELDHVDPAKKWTHKVWGRRADLRDAELAKCQALCHGCHKAKTAEDAARRAAGRQTCRKGHTLTPDNTYAYGFGRQCRTCQLESAERRRRDRGIAPARRRVTHCIHGHEYTPQNTYITKSGRYRCKKCRAEDMKRRSQRRESA